MGYIDPGNKVKTDGEFKYQVLKLSSEISRLEKSALASDRDAQNLRERMHELYKLCNYNAGLLVPYFFPNFHGKGDPLSLFARPFSFAMLHLQVGGYIVVRASRQIGKSTTIGIRQLINTHMIPGFKSMYVAPHSDHIDTYADRLREMERSFRFYKSNPRYRQNLKFKEYPNGSGIKIIRVFTTALAARGNSAEEVIFDECVALDTLVDTPAGKRQIKDLKAGDKVWSFNESLRIEEDIVSNFQDKGIRHAWRLNLSNGGTVVCTGNTRVRTSSGWTYLCELLPDEEVRKCPISSALMSHLRKTRATNTWFAPRGCPFEYDCASPESCIFSWSEAGGILQSEIQHLERICRYSCQEDGELRIRYLPMGVPHADITFARPSNTAVYGTISADTYTPSKKTIDAMAGKADVGWMGMVFPRRWNIIEQCGTPSYRRFYRNRSTDDSSSTLYYRCCSQTVPGEYERKNSTHCNTDVTSKQGLYPSDPSICTSVYGLQILCETETNIHMRALRNGVYEETGTSSIHKHMQQRCLQEDNSKDKTDKYTNKPGAERTEKKEVERALLCGYTGFERESKKDKCQETIRSSKERSSFKMEAGVEEETQTGRIAEDVEPYNITSIEYEGEVHVCDISVLKNNTFIAGGVAVHNCQNFDAALYPEVAQIQKAAKTPMTVFAGTSLTVDSFLEAQYQDTSRSTWHVKSPDGKTWVNMGDVEIVDKIIGPMGPTCPVTGKILDVTNGQWVHENTRALDGGFIGFHVPQVIIPEYAANPIKWDEIYQSYNKFDRNKFLQEIMGIPTEEGVREITQHDLERICTLGSREALRRKAINNGYKLVVSGCDWGGSDYNPALAIKASYTVHAIIGVNHDNSMEIIFIRQHSGMDYRAVANEIIKDHTAYGGNAMASDFGVGAAYNMLIRESGRVTPDRHFIFNYTGPSAAPVTSPAQGHGWYNQYGLNRTESITSLYAAIKKDPPRLRCYSWDESGPRLMEFLNLYRAPTESTTTGAFSFRYIRHGSKPDDTLHAVNFAYSMARIFIGEPIIQDEALKLRVEQVLRHGNAIKNPLDMLYRGGVVSG